MNDFDSIDWEAVLDLARRFGGVFLAILFALAVRRRKRKTAPEEEVALEEEIVEVPPIEPGSDLEKLTRQLAPGEET